MKYSSVILLLNFDLILSFISEVFSWIFYQVTRTTISFTWRIIGTTSLLISTTNVVLLIFNWWRCFLFVFSTSGIISYFALLLGLSGFWILYFSVIKVSEVFFLLFLQRIHCLYSVTLDTLYPWPDIPERIELSFLTSSSLVFPILVILSDNMADEIDLDLFTDFTVSSVSVLWLDLDLFNDLPLYDLFLMYLSDFF